MSNPTATNFYRAPVSNEKVSKAVEAVVRLDGGETMIAVIDTTALGSGKEGLVVTDRRLIRYDKKGAYPIAREDFESAVLTEKFPYPVRLNHRNGTVVLPGITAKQGREICHLIRATARGDVAAAMAPPPEEALAPPLLATSAPDVFRIFHGRVHTNATSDLGTFLAILFVGPIVLAGFWLGAHREGLTAAFFRVSFYLGLVGWPFLLWNSWKDYRKKGPRKVIYCVNSGLLAKLLLRGESHPLWDATEASPPIQADQSWRRDGATIFLRQGAIVVEWRRSAMVSGSTTMVEKISRDEFADSTQFEALVDSLGLRP